MICIIQVYVSNSIFANIYLNKLIANIVQFRSLLHRVLKTKQKEIIFFLIYIDTTVSTKGTPLGKIDRSRYYETKFHTRAFNCSKNWARNFRPSAIAAAKSCPGTLRPSFPDLIRFSAKVVTKWSEKRERWKRSQISCRAVTLVATFR